MGKAAPSSRDFRDTPPSQETGGVASLLRMPLACASGQPSTPAREGEEESMRLCRLSACVFPMFAAFLLQIVFAPSAAAQKQNAQQQAVTKNSATLAGTITDP